jgi:hypothetical protein
MHARPECGQYLLNLQAARLLLWFVYDISCANGHKVTTCLKKVVDQLPNSFQTITQRRSSRCAALLIPLGEEAGEVEVADHAGFMDDDADCEGGSVGANAGGQRLNRVVSNCQQVGHTVHDKADNATADFHHDDRGSFGFGIGLHAELYGQVNDRNDRAPQVHYADHFGRRLRNGCRFP